MKFFHFTFLTIILLITLYRSNGKLYKNDEKFTNDGDEENLTRDARNAYDDLTSDEHDYWQEFLSDGVEHPAVYMPKKTTQSS
uniref:Uncharacterized protein n=1 Tax=Strongyloides stercoralis TaxID=6248 RepID=A0A0K0EBH8_STRER